MSIVDFIFFGFATIPRLLSMKPKNFPAETPKAHLVGFNSSCSLSRPGTIQLGFAHVAQPLLTSPTCRLCILPRMLQSISGAFCFQTFDR